MPNPATLVFVHGFWHGSWCWSEVVSRVVAAGRLAVAVDMAGHGLRARRPLWFTGRSTRTRSSPTPPPAC